jgi:hypothetical protein
MNDQDNPRGKHPWNNGADKRRMQYKTPRIQTFGTVNSITRKFGSSATLDHNNNNQYAVS